MKVIDLVIDAAGLPYVLTETGELYGRLPINGVKYQHLTQSARPTHEWVAILGPADVTPSRVFIAGDKLMVLADGVLYERTKDLTHLYGQKWLWSEVEIDLGEPK